MTLLMSKLLKKFKLYLKYWMVTVAKRNLNIRKLLKQEELCLLSCRAETQKKLRNYCKSYFMEVVSSLCFGQLSPPEPALIEELLNVVFTEQDQTKDFTYSDKEEIDKVPVIRSFLLQLLLEHK